MKYEVVIGLETHVELDTKSKIFCSCGGHSEHVEPNDCVCPACCGMPGMLPVTNKKAVEKAIMAGLMLNCKINEYVTFDKKSYYYPDLPCAYQITQWFHPICVEGSVEVTTKDGTRTIGIKQIHMEEDAGKLVHDEWSDTTLVDYNRTSVPLIEIVTKPDFRSSAEVLAYLETLKANFRFAGISECEEGAMRCDVNISVRPQGSTELGVRTEIKNMSSFAAIEKAIEFEIARHIDANERQTEVLVQGTRRWDDDKKRTFPMRNKETAADYRYFPDPNLMPIIIDEKWVESVRASMYVTPQEKKQEYLEKGLLESEADTLIVERKVCDLLDKLVENGIDLKEGATWILTDCTSVLRRLGKTLADLKISAEKLIAIIGLVKDNTVNRSAGKKILSAVIEKDVDPIAYYKEQGLDSQGDTGLIEQIVKKVIDNNPNAVKDYKEGKTKAVGFLFGMIMRELRGNGDPQVINQILTKYLNQ